jgi:hypothetical protein
LSPSPISMMSGRRPGGPWAGASLGAAHAGLPHSKARVVLPEPGHFFLETADGRQVYFHRNSLAGSDFDRLVRGPR